MDLDARLRAFAALARTGSFTRAAAALYLSQPAVSKHIGALEAELRQRLVVRAPRKVSLTPAGQVLADYVLRAQALLANGRRAVASGGDAQIGTLSLAASGIPGTYLLPAIVAHFRVQHPAVGIEFEVGTSAGAIEAVRAHRAEIGVVGGLTVPPELDSEPILDDRIVLVGPPALAARRLRPKELEGFCWVSREEGSSTRAAVEAARWQMGLHAVQELELPSWEAVKLAVAGGAGIAAISHFALDLELKARKLTVLDVPAWRLERTISLVTARDVPLTPPALRFISMVRSAFERGQAARPRPPLRNRGHRGRARPR